MRYRAIVFVRRSGAYGIGHVGWAFANNDNTFSVGSVENHHGRLSAPPAEMGFWTVDSSDPIQPMRTRHYDEFKVIDVKHADPSYAKHIVAWVQQQVYEVIGRNCMDDTYDVLRAYGIEQLPVPAQIWEPNHWFNHLPGQHYHIEPEGVDQEKGEKPMAHGPILADLASLAREPLAGVAPVPPAWRLAGTIEAAHFQESIKMTPPMPIMHRHFFAPLLRFFGVASQQRL